MSDYTAVFFNLFAATEPSANACVTHGTLCNCEAAVLLQPHRAVVANFVTGTFGLFRGTPGSHSWNPEVPQNPG